MSQRFTASTRAITFVGGLLIACALQVDTIGLVNRLSADDMLRQAFVNRASSDRRLAPGGATAQAADAGVANAVPQPAAEPAREAIDMQYLSFLADNGLISVARNRGEWTERWGEINPAGVLVTSLLLSLGAPFWYGALGRLLQLRSVLAAKDDDQRNARQASRQNTTDAAPIS